MIQIAKILYGSQNYQLDSVNSDRDYKILVCPTWHDIVWKQTDRTHVTDTGHESYWDIRNWFKEIMRGNPNAWELLWSVDTEFYNADFVKFCHFLRLHSEELFTSFFNDNTVKMWYGIAMKCGENTDERKGCARRLYFFNVFKYLVEHNLKMTADTWRSPSVVDQPRAIRYNDAALDIETPFDEVASKLVTRQSKEFSERIAQDCIYDFECFVFNTIQQELHK